MRPPARAIALLSLLLALLLVAGCGDNSDSTSSSATSTTTSTDTVEGDLQAQLDEATQACKESAGQISNSTLSGAAEAACDQLNSSLSQDIASGADQAKGNTAKALDDLAAQCRRTAESLPAGQDVVNSFCDAISAGSSSVSGSN